MLSFASMKANIPIFSFSKQTPSCGFLFSNLPQGRTLSLIEKGEIHYQQQHRLIIQFNSWSNETFLLAETEAQRTRFFVSNTEHETYLCVGIYSLELI
jgi:hypothetical protein